MGNQGGSAPQILGPPAKVALLVFCRGLDYEQIVNEVSYLNINNSNQLISSD